MFKGETLQYIYTVDINKDSSRIVIGNTNAETT